MINLKYVFWLIMLTSSLFLTACLGTVDWREVKIDAIGLEAQLPCKPEQRAGELPLLAGGKMLAVNMSGCKSSDELYAIAYAEVPAGDNAQDVLQHWQSAMQNQTGAAAQSLQLKSERKAQAIVLASVLLADQVSSAGKADLSKAELPKTIQTKRANFFSSLRWVKG